MFWRSSGPAAAAHLGVERIDGARVVIAAAVRDVDVIVVGAGCGGLAACALLAGQGRRVGVVEQTGAVGGCASGFERKAYRFDVAASIMEVLEPLRRVFAALGTTLEDELELVACTRGSTD